MTHSTKGFEPFVFLSTAKSNQSGDIKSSIKFNKLRIPSYGVATTPVTIAASEGAANGPYTLVIFANSTFFGSILLDFNIPGTGQDVISASTVTITVQEPLTLLDRLGFSSSGIPINILNPLCLA